MKLTSGERNKLNRAAIEPARVFARRDFDPNDKRPVLHFGWQDREFYSPHFPTWMFEGTNWPEDKVLHKAIERYGLEEAPVTGEWWTFAEFLFNANTGETVFLPEAEYKQMKNGTIVPFFAVGGNEYIAATPVMYAVRKYGEVSFKKGGHFVRVHCNGSVVGVIRTQDGQFLREPTTEG